MQELQKIFSLKLEWMDSAASECCLPPYRLVVVLSCLWLAVNVFSSHVQHVTCTACDKQADSAADLSHYHPHCGVCGVLLSTVPGFRHSSVLCRANTSCCRAALVTLASSCILAISASKVVNAASGLM